MWIYRDEFYGWLGTTKTPACHSKHYAEVPEEMAARLKEAADTLCAVDNEIDEYLRSGIALRLVVAKDAII